MQLPEQDAFIERQVMDYFSHIKGQLCGGVRDEEEEAEEVEDPFMHHFFECLRRGRRAENVEDAKEEEEVRIAIIGGHGGEGYRYPPPGG